MEHSKELKLENQLIFGRDKLWLKSLTQVENNLTMVLEVDFENGSKFVTLFFDQVVFYSSTELDTYEKSKWSSSWLTSLSNIELIENSDLIGSVVKIRDDYQTKKFNHYRISTYDYILDIIASDYSVTVQK